MTAENDGTVSSRVSAEDADWRREQPAQFWDPPRKLLRAIRHYQYWRDRNGLIAAVGR